RRVPPGHQPHHRSVRRSVTSVTPSSVPGSDHHGVLARLLAAVAALSLAAVRVQAAGAVGDGTPGSCTQAPSSPPLPRPVPLHCRAPAVIPITSTKPLAATTTIDGTGQYIVFDGGSAVRLFQTTYGSSPITLTFRNVTLRNGRAPDFGGAIRLAYQEPA